MRDCRKCRTTWRGCIRHPKECKVYLIAMFVLNHDWSFRYSVHVLQGGSRCLSPGKPSFCRRFASSTYWSGCLFKTNSNLQIKPKARVPISHFRVGAAAYTASGRIFLGTNMEFKNVAMNQVQLLSVGVP